MELGLTSTETTTQQPATKQELTHEELMAALKKQIEYYFSKENLANDSYLVSHMNDSGYVPLAQIANFRKVNSLSSNMDDILEALKSSDKVVVDVPNLLIKPAFNYERKTVILRDVPSESTEEEIRGLFDGVATVESAKMEFPGTWFVVLDSEKSAIASLTALYEKKLHDQTVKARLKNESFLKNLTRELAPKIDGIPAEFVVPMGTQPMMFTNPEGLSMMMPFPQVAMMGEPESKGKKTRHDRKRHERRNRTIQQPAILPSFHNEELFPPLVHTVAPKHVVIGTRYSYAEICDIVKDIKDTSCPPIECDCEDVNSVITAEANADLVHKGRTFSIDQAMQRGVPRSMSVDSVDYTAMLMGEVDEDVAARVRKTRKEKKNKKLDYRNVLKNVPAETVIEAPAVIPVVKTAPAVKPVVEENEAVKEKDTKDKKKNGPKKVVEKKPKKKAVEKKPKKTDDDGWTTVVEKKH